MEVMKSPCKECPFKNNSLKGYLGGFSIEQTIDVAKSEQSFICHKIRQTDNKKECAGRLLFASKVCKSFKNPELESLRLEIKQNNTTNNILGFDFKSYHTIEV